MYACLRACSLREGSRAPLSGCGVDAQARGMREQVQSMSGKVAALQAHCGTLQGEAERWQALWRQAAAANSQLTQRAAAGADSQVAALCSQTCLRPPTVDMSPCLSEEVRARPHYACARFLCCFV